MPNYINFTKPNVSFKLEIGKSYRDFTLKHGVEPNAVLIGVDRIGKLKNRIALYTSHQEIELKVIRSSQLNLIKVCLV